MAKDYTPSTDASLGLVFRLNSLWNRADYAALAADYDKWNNILDAIYRNLLYREEMVVEETNGAITKVQFKKKDTKIYGFLSKRVADCRKEFKTAGGSMQKKAQARSKWYHALQKKDIWLRKYMKQLNLYLKETEKRPGTAMFGKFGGGKR